MKTHTLDISGEENFDFDVFSITCTESIYRVISDINQHLNIDLQLSELLDYRHTEGEEFYFPVYSFKHEELNIEFNLVANETSLQPNQVKTTEDVFDLFAGDVEQTTKLLPELENSDFLLLVKGENRLNYNHTILKELQGISLFIIVREIFMEDLKDKKSRSGLLF